MRIGTTEIHTFTLPYALSTVSKLYVTYQQSGVNVLEKNVTDDADQFALDGNVLTLTLTQEDTLRFEEGDVEMEITVEYAGNGAIGKSKIETVPVERSLREQVI